MTTQKWKMYKRDLFSSSARRKVKINDIKIQTNGASSVVTFKQSYQTAKHQDRRLKTLQLCRHKDRWTVFKEKRHPIPAQG